MNRLDILSFFQHYHLLDKNFDEHVENISGLFGSCSKNFIFEIPLEGNDPKVEFSLNIRRTELLQLLDYWGKKELKSLLQNESWDKIMKFLIEWGNPNSSVHKNIQDVWFEFDRNQLYVELPVPCFFFSPRNLLNDVSRVINKEKINVDWLLNLLLIILPKNQLTKKIKGNLLKCIEKLPPRGVIFQIGVMMPRDFNGLRICTSMRADYYLSYLDKIGWIGSFNHLEDILNNLKKYVDAFFLDFDVEEKILQTLGIECCYRMGKDTLHKLEKFLNYLTSRDLCTKEKACFILSWCTIDKDFKKNLSHIKIVLPPSHVLKAKAYLAISNLPGEIT
jgi:hypothetical protein